MQLTEKLRQKDCQVQAQPKILQHSKTLSQKKPVFLKFFFRKGLEM